ncbi:hypothetical protein RB195_013889 [Necator americanus]|uniref:Uncharacterized protein n=1 Tax=Necator americanus TaxID=51031 RepID=A0ABR1DXS4_NECAM
MTAQLSFCSSDGRVVHSYLGKIEENEFALNVQQLCRPVNILFSRSKFPILKREDKWGSSSSAPPYTAPVSASAASPYQLIPYSCTTLHAYYCIVILASPTMSSFPPSACVMLMGNPTLSQSCSVKGSQRCNIKTERKISSSLIACRLRELCDRFEEEEFTLQRCTVGNYNENPANKIAQWFLPRAFFQGFLVTTYDRWDHS